MDMLKDRIGKIIKVLKDFTCKNRYSINRCRIMDSENSFSVPSFSDPKWREFSENDYWGGNNRRFWFDLLFIVPEEASGDTLYFTLITGKEKGWDAINPQFAVYVDGVLRQGFDVNHRQLLLAENAKAGTEYHIVLSALSGDNNFDLRFIPRVASIDRKTEKYCYDLSIPYQIAWELNDESSEAIEIINDINSSINLLDLRHPYSDEYYEALEAAQSYITEKLYSHPSSDNRPSVYCVGHTHIDLAWMWILAITKEKAVRSFSTVLELMDRYPEYKFISSQPQLYKYVKEYAPENYERIRKRIAEGRWEVEGGMFVEADCNIPSGESLVRQFVHGLRFFKDEFGKKNEILWLPDVFGYSAALPQIMKKCGIRYFMTTKISWSETNRMPYDTFMWEGIDGTRILTHFSPCRDNHVPESGIWDDKHRPAHFTTYNSLLTPSQVIGSWKRYSQKSLNKEVLICCGYGDGGGGTTPEMLENQRRLSYGIPGAPVTRISTAADFFHKLESSVKGREELPIWVGELYLEYHRGTYTSMARNKRSNRYSEFLLENAELFSTIASRLCSSYYDSEEIWNIWEIVLKNQFHDILPGSAIKEVYDDSKAEYEEISARGEKLLNDKLVDIANAVKGSGVVVFNPNGFEGEGIINVDMDYDALTDGSDIFYVQHNENGNIAYVKGIPSKGYRLLQACPDIDKGNHIAVDEYHIENDLISVSFDNEGHFTSIYDKHEARELIPDGKFGNVLTVYEDRPHNYDAWDINCYYTERKWNVGKPISVGIKERGPVRASICFTYRYQNSIIEETISLADGNNEIMLHFDVDWKECYSLLRFSLPADIHADEATYEIQYGNVRRPAHKNTSWDQAKFEVCMHKWLDFSEGGYGVSVLNDSKYGSDVHFGTIGVSLIKSAMYPNPEADKEKHSFTLSIFPHHGDWKEAGTVKRAYALNNPLIAIAKDNEGAGALDGSFSLVSSSSRNIAIEAVKHSDDGNGIVVRCFEFENCRTNAVFHIADNAEVYDCNLLEEIECPLECAGNHFSAVFEPFEIKTFKIVPLNK